MRYEKSLIVMTLFLVSAKSIAQSPNANLPLQPMMPSGAWDSELRSELVEDIVRDNIPIGENKPVLPPSIPSPNVASPQPTVGEQTVPQNQFGDNFGMPP